MVAFVLQMSFFVSLITIEHGVKEMKAFVSLMPLLFICIAASAFSQKATRPVTVFIEGDSSVIPKFINICRQKGPERGLEFRFVDKQADAYDYRVVLSSEGSGAWNYAHGNVVVMNPEAKVLFTVTRSNRLTAKGAASALSKEFVKVLARYLGTHR
jgi:hypothetical protein